VITADDDDGRVDGGGGFCFVHVF
jgi:hypothetical protein